MSIPSSTVARRAVMLSLAVASAAPAATYTWLPALGGGDWNTGANWQIGASPAGQPPTTLDVASFTTVTGTTPTTAHTVTVPTPVSVRGLLLVRKALTLDVPAGSSLTVTGTGSPANETLLINGATLNVAGTLTTNTATFSAGQVIGTVDFASDTTGHLALGGGPTVLGGSFRFNGTGDVSTGPNNTNGNITAGVTLIARAVTTGTTGQLKLLGAGSQSASNYGTINLDSAASVANSGVNLVTNGTFYNYAALNLNAGGTGTNSRTVTGNVQNYNTGTINVAAGVTANFTQNFNNDGALAIASGASLTVPSFSQNLSTAVTTVNGKLTAADVNYYGGTINGTVELAGNNLNGTRQLTLGTSTGTAAFVLQGGGTLSAGSGIGQAMAVTARATSASPSATLKFVGTSLNNYGTLTLASDSGASVSDVTLANDTSAGTLYNYGTLNLNAGATATNSRTLPGGLQNYNNGKINIAPGVAATVGQNLNNDGTLTIASGASLTVSQFSQNLNTAVTNINGTLTAKDVNYYGGQLNGVVELAGNDLNNTRQLTIGSSGGTATFVMQGGGTLSVGSGVPQAVSLTARAVPALPSATLKFFGTSLNNYGTLTLASDAAVTNSTLTLTQDGGGTGTVYNYGTLNLNAGASGTNARTLPGGLQNYNNGTINLAPGVTASVVQNLNNDGTLNIAAGSSLTVGQFSQNLSTAVTNINGALTATDVNYYGGRLNGVVTLAGNNLNGTRQLNIGATGGTATFVMQGAGTLGTGSGIPQAISVTARATAAKATPVLSVPSSLNNYGTLTLDADSAASNSVVTLNSTSTYNYGTLNLNAGGSGTNGRVISGGLQNYNNGTVNIAPGVAATVVQNFNNDGTLTIANGASLAVGQFSQNLNTAVTNINGTLMAAGVNYYGGRLDGIVTLAGPNTNTPATLNIGASNGTATFIVQGNGTLSAGSGVPQAVSVTARAVGLSGLSILKASGSSLNNYGLLVLDADGTAADSLVKLTSDSSTGIVYNYGVLGLGAGSAGLNERRIEGGVQNYPTGSLNVANGVHATITQQFNNDGAITINPGASLTAASFAQNVSTAVTTVNGTLTAPDVTFYGGRINGEITLAGTDPGGKRRLILGTTNGTAGFVLQGGGDITLNGTAVGPATRVTGRAMAAMPATVTLGSGSTANNDGTLTLDADANAHDSVATLAVPGPGGNGYGTLFNSGTLNFNAGGTGTNTRQLPGMLYNNHSGGVNVNADTVFGGPVLNHGTISLNAPATFQQAFTNETDGTLNLNVTPTFQNGFTNRGTLNVSAPPTPPGGGTEPPPPVEVPYPIGGDGDFVQSGAGTVVLSGANTYTGETSVANPQATLVATPAAYQNVLTNEGGLDVKAGAFVFQYDTPGPAGGPAAVRSALRRVAAESAPSPIGTIRALLVQGHVDHFTTGQIRSSTATAARGLGYVDDGDSVTLKATFYGDADLDGGVSINDFNALAMHFGRPAGQAWADGDFDYDGGVSINDFNLLAANFGKSSAGGASAVDYSGLLAFAAAHNDLAAFEAVTGVPEPTALAGVMAIAGMAAARRRSSPRRGDGL